MKKTQLFIFQNRLLWVKIPVLLIAFLSFFLFSCAQDSIFFDISNEPEPIEPRVAGTVTNMVVANGYLYAGTRMSKTIHAYRNWGWKTIDSPGAPLLNLASDGANLYALAGDPLGQPAVKRYDASGRVDKTIYSGRSIQALYGVNGRIFAGEKKSETQYAVLELDTSTFDWTVLDGSMSLLTGAAEIGGRVYITAGKGREKEAPGSGVFEVTGAPGSASLTRVTGGNMVGITSTGTHVVAVTSDGWVVYIDGGGSSSDFSTGQRMTGGLGIWRKYNASFKAGDPLYDMYFLSDPLNTIQFWEPALLLVGIHETGNSLTHGYRELELNTSTGEPYNGLRVPGEGSPSSVENNPMYDAGLGTHPVHSILQVPPGVINYPGNSKWQPPIFATTSKDGLWSYKERDGELTWNAER